MDQDDFSAQCGPNHCLVWFERNGTRGRKILEMARKSYKDSVIHCLLSSGPARSGVSQEHDLQMCFIHQTLCQ